jgi:hypothetical protein
VVGVVVNTSTYRSNRSDVPLSPRSDLLVMKFEKEGSKFDAQLLGSLMGAL